MNKEKIKQYKQWNSFDKEEKKELLLRAKEGDKYSLDKIWKSVLGGVFKINSLFKFNSGSLSVEDLVQESFIFFKNCIDNFNIESEVNFFSYLLTSIKRNQRDVIAKKGGDIAIPNNIATVKFKINRFLLSIGQESINENNISLISKELGIKESRLKVINNTYSSSIIGSLSEYNNIENFDDVDNFSTKLELLEKELNLIEFTIIKKLLGIKTKQLTKNILMKRQNVSRTAIDKALNKARKVLNYEN